MSDTYYVKTFGGLEITNDNVTVNIVKIIWKAASEFITGLIVSQ